MFLQHPFPIPIGIAMAEPFFAHNILFSLNNFFSLPLKLPSLKKRGMNLPVAEKGEIFLANMFSNPSDPPLAGHLPLVKGGAVFCQFLCLHHIPFYFFEHTPLFKKEGNESACGGERGDSSCKHVL
ncbi:hypothetical protein [Arenibacter sp. GZD-96]|uniref:hypothetical protein n=1 Tax=Aurantibrevibacter litoralis TaxID=3106030 RepID=UPI002AFDF323|nr:hypothetical protein [Arenibacter sp. GZD-96]